jgi:EAL domain-containing protein (putative c-di-GMP-specific phosphodiesterase class I)
MKAWQDAGSCKIPVSVNLSFSQFHDDQLPEYIRHVLQANGLDPQYLILEITESMMAEDFRHSARMLRKIKDMGIKVSVDDFGTGYSSLSYLKHLPVDRIKIDRSFVTDIAQNKRDKAIVAAIVDLAEHLLIEVIAEGIENEEQLHAVEQCRCRAIQGFYYSRPLSCGDFQRYMMTGGGEIS